MLSNDQLIQREAIQSGQAHVELEPIRAWLDGLEYPIHCLDFETMSPAIPIIEDTRPYQQIPFQFSLHILDREDAVPHHIEFLAVSPGDPRPALIEALMAIGPAGTILAYNMSFERRILHELAGVFPAYKNFISDLDRRFKDLITPFDKFWFYDAKQSGSCSLKDVLPVLTNKSYEGMDISDRSKALLEYTRVVYGGTHYEEKARLLDSLRKYCAQDTRALIDILNALKALFNPTQTRY